MSVSAAAAAKAAAILSGGQSPKTVRRFFSFLFGPLGLVVVLLLLLAYGTAQHNGQTVDACFYGPQFSEKVPGEFQSQVDAVRGRFEALDAEVAAINRQANGGTGLDAVRIKSVFYALYFGKQDWFPFCFLKREPFLL